ncbi:MAG: orotate phosphoribosyltransferase [Rhodobacteraceae bacterium]|nr:orotate phosphoribosyltransferase [Paracoccaceae bacterium]
MIPSACPDARTIARMTARVLLDIGAVQFSTAPPYTHASGKQAPTYIDCRKLISYPRARAMVMDFLICTVVRHTGPEVFDIIAGGETAGIPFAAMMAERLALPMAYVRKAPKGHGRTAQIEGVLPPGARVLLVEDLATDGGSKQAFVRAIRTAGAECAHTAVIFYYGIFPEAKANLAARGITLHHLCTWADVMAEARQRGDFDAATLDQVARFLANPGGWEAP